MDRRAFLASSAAIAGLLPELAAAAAQPATRTGPTGSDQMFGLIGKMTATPGQREALLAILLDGTSNMPGCLSYIIAKDPSNADAIWITEVWDSKASHDASLKLPAVQAAIAKAKPLIAGFSDHVTTEPVGGHGLVASKD